MAFSKMTIRQQLTIGFGALATACLALAAISIHALNVSNKDFTDYVQGINLRAQVVGRLGHSMKDRAIAARNLILATNQAERDVQSNAALHAHKDVLEHLKKYNALVASSTDMSDRARVAAAELNKVEQAYAPVALSVVDMAVKGDHAGAVSKMNAQCLPLLTRLNKVLDDYIAITEEGETQRIEAAANDFKEQRSLLLATSALAVFASFAVGFVIIKQLFSALGAEPAALREAVGRIADGDLSPVAGGRDAPAGSVLASMDVMQGNLVRLIGQIKVMADQIASASSQIASGNLDLSGRTEQQASALQQTAGTMEELGATVRHNADSAGQANQLAIGASGVAEKGGEVVSEFVQTMRGINDSSRKIADIITVIDGIAFQTNILALNAAVEAARAGEQGRGFAVVAGEVRSLAQRSAEAAKEIKSLITSSVEQVEQGSVLVDRAGQTMSEIVSSIKRVTDIVNEISSASIQQSAGVSQVGQAVNQLDQATQQNAALVEENAAAAASLQQQARAMSDVVGEFRLQSA